MIRSERQKLVARAQRAGIRNAAAKRSDQLRAELAEHASSSLVRDTTALQNAEAPMAHDAFRIYSGSPAVMITALQACLAAQGHYCQIDGQWGRQTVAAVHRFQTMHDLDPTNDVDRDLFIEIAAGVVEPLIAQPEATTDDVLAT